MALSTPRPLWGWTAAARGWMTLSGALAALGLWCGTGTPDGPPGPEPRLVVDPNTAPAGVLGALPKLGPSLIGRIVTARDEAPFRSLDDFDERVRGIGPATLASLRPFLRIAPPGTGATPPLPSPLVSATATATVRLARSP
jgi:DNA uptake protein ComE-like DNA-binding protein